MNGFAWALAGFVLLHVGVSASGLRGVFVRAIGEWPYRGLFSLASLGLLVWLVTGYGAMRADPFDPLNEALWAPADWVRGVGAAINLFGVTLAAAGVLTPGPTDRKSFV